MYAKHIVGDQVRPCRIKRRGRNNCRVIWLDSGLEQLVPRPELQECTAEEAGVGESTSETTQATPQTPAGPSLSGEEVSRLMRNYQATIKDLAEKLGVTEDQVREARRDGVADELVAFEWKKAICGEEQPEAETAEPVAA